MQTRDVALVKEETFSQTARLLLTDLLTVRLPLTDLLTGLQTVRLLLTGLLTDLLVTMEVIVTQVVMGVKEIIVVGQTQKDVNVVGT